MIKIPIYLALMTLSHCLNTILFHAQPIIPLSDYFLRQNYTIHMRSTYSYMNLSHHFICFILLEISQLCSIQHSFVQYPIMTCIVTCKNMKSIFFFQSCFIWILSLFDKLLDFIKLLLLFWSYLSTHD